MFYSYEIRNMALRNGPGRTIGADLHSLTPTGTGNANSQNKIFQLINFHLVCSRRPVVIELAAMKRRALAGHRVFIWSVCY